MAPRFDPRGDLPPSIIQPASHIVNRSSATMRSFSNTRRLSQLSLSSRLRLKPCYDWIFSSATDVHVALDRSAFKEYTAFQSYVLTLSDHRRVHVEGIGCVELKIRRRPENKENHTIVLNEVLHIPSWHCNIVSDIYFDAGHEYEHSWNEFGVQFSQREDNELRPWGYTESFFSLDRLVLAKRHKDGRSPMLDDRDREVFSVNLKWPQSQRDRWTTFLAEHDGYRLSRVVSEPGLLINKNAATTEAQDCAEQHATTRIASRRATLSNINANSVRQIPSKRRSSLKATFSGYGFDTGKI